MRPAVSDRRGPEPGRRPRIAIVTHTFAPSSGGTEAYYEIVATGLPPSVQVGVFTSDRMLAEHPERRPLPALPYPVHYLASRRFFGERLVLPGTLWPALARFDPDVIWTNHPSLTSDFAAGFATLHGVPWIATYHADLDRARPYAVVYNRMSGWVLRLAAAVVVTSEKYARRLGGRGVPAGRIRIIPLGVHIGRGRAPPVAGPGVGAGEGPGVDHPLLFVGGLDTPRAYKRPEDLIAAVRLLRESGRGVALEIVGDGDRRQALEAMAHDAGLDSSVRFRGRLSDEELAERFHSAWALVLPSSDSEGFGVVALEAAYYGCPVISSDVPPAGEFLARRGCAVVYPGGDVSALAESIWTVWSDAPRRHALAEAARRVGTGFTWDEAMPPIRDLLVGVAQDHATARAVAT